MKIANITYRIYPWHYRFWYNYVASNDGGGMLTERLSPYGVEETVEKITTKKITGVIYAPNYLQATC